MLLFYINDISLIKINDLSNYQYKYAFIIFGLIEKKL